MAPSGSLEDELKVVVVDVVEVVVVDGERKPSTSGGGWQVSSEFLVINFSDAFPVDPLTICELSSLWFSNNSVSSCSRRIKPL